MFTQGWELIGQNFTLYRIQRWAVVCKTMVEYVLSPQNGQTALMLASDCGHTKVVQLLLSSGAKIDLQSKVRHDINQKP